MSGKVFVIGLDCAEPSLIFEKWRDDLPNLRRFANLGVFGELESTIPPITVPAWMCMMTGKDPGTLGIYGFRNRSDHSYNRLNFANSTRVQEPTLWDILAQHGKKSIALGVPLTYPPRPIHGHLVADFLTPDTNSDYTYPPALKEEIREQFGEYHFDTKDFRTEEKDRLLSDIYTMTRQRFEVARYLARKKEWDFFIMVEMGLDRIHHAFWKFFDPAHPKYEQGNRFENAIHDYYVAVDAEIGRLIETMDEDTTLLIVSDHGAKRMDGAICFNQWLIQEGYLVLKETPQSVTKFDVDSVDWAKTTAWGDGGYYGRLFLNIAGREPQGTIPPNEVEKVKAEITAKLEALDDENGDPIGTKVFRPETTYTHVRNVSPDLIVYFGDLHWRSVGSVGHPSVWTRENDTGPDDANHAQQGIFLMAEARDFQRGLFSKAGGGERKVGLSIYDIAPTVLGAFGIVPPPGMGRNSIGTTSDAEEVYSEEEEAELARRLEDLGYL